MVGKLKQAISWPRLAKWSLVLAILVLAWFVYFWQLGTLVPGLSTAEVTTRSHSHSLQAILDQPLNASYYLWQYLLQLLGDGRPFALRLGSSLIAVGLVYCFFVTVRRWAGALIAGLAGLAFASLPWLVINARTATPDIMWLTPLVLVSLYVWLLSSPAHRGLKFNLLVIVGALALYTPGLFWLELVGLILARRELWAIFKGLNWPLKLLSIFIGLVLIAPLIRGLIVHHVSLRSWLLIPHHWASLIISLKSIAWSLLAFIWRTPLHWPTLLGRLPILSSGLIVLTVLGAAHIYLQHGRRLVWAGLGWLGWVAVLAGINQNWQILGLAVPFCLLAAAYGLQYLHTEWRTVFPRNPLAKLVALTLILGLIGLQLVYAVRYSLIAWPNTEATRQTYMLK